MNVSADHRKLILDAVTRLPAEQRAVLRRSHYDHQTIAQIAADLHVDESTVKARLHHGVRALLVSLKGLGVTDDWGHALDRREVSH